MRMNEESKKSEETSLSVNEAATKGSAPNVAGKNDVWALVGKIGALVALVTGVITVYSTLNPRGPNVSATCNTTEISEYLKYGALKVTDQFKEIVSVEGLSKAMPYEAGKSAQSKPALEALSLTLLRNVEFARRFDLREINRVLQCDVINDGTEPAAEVDLQIPAHPVRVLRDGEELSAESFKAKSITLGNLPAGPKMRVEVWSSDYLVSPSDRSTVFINFRGGKGRVNFVESYSGFAASLGYFWKNFGLLGLLWLSTCVLVISLIAIGATVRFGRSK